MSENPQPSESKPPEAEQPAPAASVPETPDAPRPAEETATTAPATPEEAQTSATTEAPEPAPADTPPPPAKGLHWGTGRRKSSVARVRLIPGDGQFRINKRDIEHYFTEIKDREAVAAPLKLTGRLKQWDVFINVNGGGFTGQSGAIRMGLARALVAADQSCEATLRDAGFLTRDARRVERKKPGRRKARRSFQFSKR